jgi:hypothetical protein
MDEETLRDITKACIIMIIASEGEVKPNECFDKRKYGTFPSTTSES